MNPYNGEIERFRERESQRERTIEELKYPRESVPPGWLKLTDEEAELFMRLPKMMRLEKYIARHRTGKCRVCERFVGNHSLRQFRECAVTELAQFETERLEKQLGLSVVAG